MLAPGDAHALFGKILVEFAAEWEPIDQLTEVTIRDRDHWLSGVGTFGTTLRHRTTGAFKVLGRRGGPTLGVSYHRGVSFLVLKAYAERNTDPVRRYLQEIGLTPLPRSVVSSKLG